MKKTLKSLLTIGLFAIIVSACQTQADTNSILENDETRKEIFNAIISNHEYSKGLMQGMMEDNHTQLMMKGSQEMMGMMMSDNKNMLNMMKDKPDMMHNMMGNMMNMADSDSLMCGQMIAMIKDKPNMMGQMMDMMHKEGMMDKETMMKNKKKIGAEKPIGHH